MSIYINKIVSSYPVIYLFMCSLLWLSLISNAPSVYALEDTVSWNKPIKLSIEGYEAWAPVVAADSAGNVHIMWSQSMTNEGLGEGDTLFYTRWDGQDITAPVDVLVSPEGAAEFPELEISPDGILHAIWATGGQNSKLMYARAPACCAEYPKNWSQPILLGMPVLYNAGLKVDNIGRLHVAFASQETNNIKYLRSDDGGLTWLVRKEIFGGMQEIGQLSAYPRLSVDRVGNVYVVWTVMPFPGQLVLYARSNDGGETWDDPVVVDSIDRVDYLPEYGPIFIDIETKGDGEVHLIWDGAPTIERNHIWSDDGGKSWSNIKLLFPEVSRVGRAGWNDMVFDSNNLLHAFSIMSAGPPLHATWDGERWSSSDQVVISGPGTSGVEFVRSAISQGNVLHIVWQKKDEKPFSVWYARGQTQAPPLPVKTLQNNLERFVVSVTPTSTKLFQDDTNNSLPENLKEIQNGRKTSLSNPAASILIAIIPVVAIVGIIVFLVFMRKTG